MSAEPTLEELLEVQAYFRLPSPALVEKDFYVVKALAAIAAVEKEALHVRLVFGAGSTATMRCSARSASAPSPIRTNSTACIG